jgi:integrase/recombinase XerD
MKLSEGISEYIVRKRISGLKYESAETRFRAFLTYTGDLQLGDVTTQQVLSYLNVRPLATCSWRSKYSQLMYFFDFWAIRGAIDPIAMPQPRAAERRTYVPHVYSREQIRSLLRAAFLLRQRYKDSTSPQTMRTLVLFLYGTGATAGESVALRSSDVTLKSGSVTLRRNRHDRPRTIPICNDLVVAMRKYERWRSKHQIRCDSFFVKNDGKPLVKSSLICNFRRLCQAASVCRRDCAFPALRDFRPTFAVHRIASWMRNGSDLNRLLPALSVYMGHASLSATQKYLSMTPERFRKELNKLSPIRRKGRWRDDKDTMAFLNSLSSSNSCRVTAGPAIEVSRHTPSKRDYRG